MFSGAPIAGAILAGIVYPLIAQETPTEGAAAKTKGERELVAAGT